MFSTKSLFVNTITADDYTEDAETWWVGAVYKNLCPSSNFRVTGPICVGPTLKMWQINHSAKCTQINKSMAHTARN